MSRWRIAVLVALLVLPVLVLVGFGTYYLWSRGLAFYVWWPLSACLALGYFLAWRWVRARQLLPPPEVSPQMHWTDRDHEAWKLVEARATAVAQFQRVDLPELTFYTTIAQELALELARFYHPKAEDPYSALTVPEILAVVELASRDLAELVDKNVPGGHLLSIRDWMWARDTAEQSLKWYRRASNTYWLVSALLSPIDTGLRYAASQVGMARPLQLFQQDLIAWFHTAYVHRLGKYLVDLNSGRLRVGARRYRELTSGSRLDEDAAPAKAPVPAVDQVTLTILGQVKMGKSSFVNAILGEQRAKTDVVPATNEVTRYDLKHPNIPTRLVLLDTVGYAHTGPRADQVRATEQAAHVSDLLVLVLHARSPARQADLDMLQALRTRYESKPDLKMPPIVAVVTHIDLLSPAMEWSPPYNWQNPQRPKEENIKQAVLAVREQLGSFLTGAVPVCASAGRVYGVDQFFLPVLAELLGEARGVGLLRCLKAEADADKVRRVFDQLLHVGDQLLKVWWQSYHKQKA
jgi:hypothetical protein